MEKSTGNCEGHTMNTIMLIGLHNVRDDDDNGNDDDDNNNNNNNIISFNNNKLNFSQSKSKCFSECIMNILL